MSVEATAAAIRSPFKGLAPFDDSDVDALLFFGRERETEVVVANVLASRLTLLYGPSGVGKSSLLRAGVAQSLRLVGETEPLAVAVFSSWSGPPLAGIEETARAGVADALGADPGDAPGSLADRVEAWTAALDGELCLVLDQLEEFFLYHGDDTAGRAFAEQLAELVTRPRLRVNVLLGVRDDALARLDAFKERIPGLFANSLRLDRLDRESARAAVLGPLGRYNALAGAGEQMSIDPALVDAVIVEVAAGRIDPGLAGRGGVEALGDEQRIEAPYLQLVLQRLWDIERERGSGILRLSTFRELGGAERIVEDHLERAMAALSPPQRDVAAGMFDHLVTPSGTKIAHEASDLATFARVGERDVDPVLRALAGDRILRPLGEEGEAGGERYEIFHDVLADAVLAWRTRHESEAALLHERSESRRRQRRLAAVAGASLAGLALMVVVTAYALTQRSEAREQASRAQVAEQHALDAAAIADEQRDRANQEAAVAEAAKEDAEDARADAQRSEAQAKDDAERAAVNEAKAEESERQATGLAADLEVERDNAVLLKQEAEREAAAAETARKETAIQAGRAEKEKNVAVAARARADDALVRVEAESLTANAAELVEVDAADSVGLALRAADKRPIPRLESVLRDALLNLRVRSIVPIGGEVRALSLSADGSRVLAAGDGDTALVFQLATPSRSVRLRHGSPVVAAAISADGRLVATAGATGPTRLWNAVTGDQLGTMPVRAGSRSLAFSPDGRLLAAAGVDRVARIWSMPGRHLLHRLPHPAPIDSVTFSPDGRRLLTVAADGRLYDVATGQRIGAVLNPQGELHVARFSPDGRLVLTGGRDDVAIVWDGEAGTELQRLASHRGDVIDVAWSKDGSLVATASSDNTAKVWMLATGVVVETVAAHRNHVTTVAFGPDDALVTGSLDGTARLWAPGAYTTTSPLFGHDGTVTRVAVAPDGRTILSSGSDGTVRLWSSTIDPRLVVRGRHVGPRSVVVSRDGRLVVTAGTDGTAIIRRANGWPLGSVTHPGGINDVALSADGALLATAGQEGADARVWRVADRRLVRRINHGAPVRSIAFDAGGARLATGGADGVANIWDLPTGKRLRGLRHGGGAVAGVAFSPDGRLLATAGSDWEGRLWRVSSGRLLQKLVGHDGDLTSIVFSPDGRRVLTASVDADARLWDVATGEGRRTLRGHSAVVSEAAFSPDGRWILTAGPIAIGLWPATASRRADVHGPLVYLRGAGSRVRSVAVGPQSVVASVGDDGALRVYRCELCAELRPLVALAKRRLEQLAAPLTAADRRRYLPEYLAR